MLAIKTIKLLMMTRKIAKMCGWKVGYFMIVEVIWLFQRSTFQRTHCAMWTKGQFHLSRVERMQYISSLWLLASWCLSLIHVFKDNEVLLYVPVYNKATGLYGGITKKLGQITLRGDDQERFFSNDYSKEKSSMFYCYMKQPLPNIFHCTAFKKHHSFLLDKNKKKVKFPKMFLYFPSTLDRREDFLQYKDHVYIQLI